MRWKTAAALIAACILLISFSSSRAMNVSDEEAIADHTNSGAAATPSSAEQIVSETQQETNDDATDSTLSQSGDEDLKGMEQAVIGADIVNIGAPSTNAAVATPTNAAVATPTNVALPPYGFAYNYDELDSMLSANTNTTVYLGGSITIQSGETLSLMSGNTINTGSYGLIVEGSISLLGKEIIGEGREQPVIEVMSGGSLHVGISDYEAPFRITATGDSARALVLRDGSEYQEYKPSCIAITANGNGSVAIEADSPLDIAYHVISAQNGVGIKSTADISMYFCKIAAGVPIQSLASVIADTCILPSAAAVSTMINRKIVSLLDKPNPIALGGLLPDEYNGQTRIRNTAVLSAEGVTDREEAIYIFADASSVNTNEIGVHPISIAVADWHTDFGIEPENLELLAVEVYDPAIPYYKTVGFASYPFPPKWYVEYLFGGDDLGGLTLWRSDDEGESWYDYTAEANIVANPGTDIKVYFQEPPDHPILLLWEAEGIGETKILRVTWDEDYNMEGDYGGDRGGVGRGANDPLPIPGDHPAKPDAPPDEPGDHPAKPDAPPDEPGSHPTNPGYPPTNPGIGSGMNSDTGSLLYSSSESVSPSPQAIPESTYDPVVLPEASADEQAHEAPIGVKQIEVSDERSVTVSGKRLAAMIEAHPVFVPFLRGELRLLLPCAGLDALDVGKDDLFKVTLFQLDKGSITIAFYINDTELTGRFDEPFLLSIPWNGEAVYVVATSGLKIAAEQSGRMAQFELYEPGTYSIVEEAPVADAALVTPDPIALAVGAVNPKPAAPQPAPVSHAALAAAPPSATTWTLYAFIGPAAVLAFVAVFRYKSYAHRKRKDIL